MVENTLYSIQYWMQYLKKNAMDEPEFTPLSKSDVPLNVTDTLGERFLNLSQEHRALQLENLQIKSEIEFAIRQLERMTSKDENTKQIVLNRLRMVLQKFEKK